MKKFFSLVFLLESILAIYYGRDMLVNHSPLTLKEVMPYAITEFVLAFVIFVLGADLLGFFGD
jgi:hypothetical protein